jgi:intracellular septation protein
MKNNTLIELLPLIAFFVVYYFTKNIFVATAVCIVASWLQLAFVKITTKTISRNTWLSTLLITVFGGLTIIFHNKTFIMIKPTILYWIFAVGLITAEKLGKAPIKSLLQEQISLPESSWKLITYLWVGFFIFMGVLNLAVAYLFNEFIWVKFKVFGGLGLTILFTIITALVINRRKVENELR